MRIAKALWNDEWGAVVCAEAVLLVTLAVIGGAVGLSTMAKSIDGEFHDVAYAFRSLDQSYCVAGHVSCGAWSAGSSFRQAPVKCSLQELRDYEKELEQLRERALKQEFDLRRPSKRPHRPRRRFDNDDD